MPYQILLFPGLGADGSLFAEQQKVFGESLSTPDWIPPESEENLQAYCQRFAKHLLESGALPSASQAERVKICLGGMSFGGMVALELAHCLNREHNYPIKKVFLIASGRTRNILSPQFVMQTKLAQAMPKAVIKALLQSQLLQKLSTTDALASDHQHLLKAMADNIDMDFFMWSLKACAGWDPGERFSAKDLPFEIVEIQGEHDFVIPSSPEEDVVTLPGAKHMIQYTQSNEVNDWIRSHIQHG